MAVGDVNSDAKPDLVVTHAERKELTVLLGDGKGGFMETPNSPFDLGHPTWNVARLDVDGNGMLNVVAAAGDGLRFMLRDGRGAFRPAPGSLPCRQGRRASRRRRRDRNVESDSVSVPLGR